MLKEVKAAGAGWGYETTEKQLAEAILNCIKEKDTLAIKGQNARELASQYDWKNIAEKTHTVFENIVKFREIQKANES